MLLDMDSFSSIQSAMSCLLILPTTTTPSGVAIAAGSQGAELSHREAGKSTLRCVHDKLLAASDCLIIQFMTSGVTIAEAASQLRVY